MRRRTSCWTPFRADHLVNLVDYFLASVQFSSGCPYKCEFCDIPELYGRNPRLKSPKQVTVQAVLPKGWRQKPDAKAFEIAPNDDFPIQLTVVPAEWDKNTWQTLTWVAKSDGQEIGTVKLRVDVVGNGLPQ